MAFRPEQSVSRHVASLGRWASRHGRELGARSLGPVIAALVTGTAGAAVPGAELVVPTDPPPAASEPAPPDTSDFERLLHQLDSEEQRLSAEVEGLGPKIDMVHARIVARGRAYYR